MQNKRNKVSANPQKQSNRRDQNAPSMGKSGRMQPPLPPNGPRPKGGIARAPLNRQASVASAYATKQSSSAPRIEATRDQCRIVHRELIASITGSSAFAVPQKFSLNPGLSATFPWLSLQATNWEQYRFNKLKFCYYTRTGSNIPGSMMMIPDYDPADAAPGTEQIASSYEDVEEDAPWKDIDCVLRPSAMFPMGPKKFIRSGSLAANLDIKTYDAGTFFVGTVDGTAVNWGKLWVEYDVTLFTPQTSPGGSSLSEFQHFATTAPTTANLVGVAPVQTGTPIVTLAGSILTFQQSGTFLVIYDASGTTLTVNATPVAAAGATYVNAYGGAGTGYVQSGSGGSTLVQGLMVSAVPGSTLTFNNTVVAGTLADLTIALVPSNYS